MANKIFDLCCSKGHTFEGWFENVEALEEQIAHGQVVCPMCTDTRIERRPSAVHIAKSRNQSHPHKEPETRKHVAMLREQLMAIVRDRAASAEDVGERFVDESRQMAHGKAPVRSIKGQCTPEQARELIKEGIVVLPVPESSNKTIH